jgi:RHS repeat-associated protein
MFNAKELDEESGMYYYEARYYNPPTFISRDPLFEKFPFMSPYAYCSNNPVNRIDPDGCNDYEVDRKTGEIKLLKKTGEETHRLVAQNRNGDVKYKRDGTYKKSMTVEKGVIDNKVSLGTNQRLDFGTDKDKAIETFNFLADNTDVEWSAIGYKGEIGKEYNNDTRSGRRGIPVIGDLNSVTTSGSESNENYGGLFAIEKSQGGNLNYHHHSHPGSNSNSYPSKGRPGEGGNDVGFWQVLWGNSPDAIMGIRAQGRTQRYKSDKYGGYVPIIR